MNTNTCAFCIEKVFNDDRNVGSVRHVAGGLVHYHIDCLYAAHPNAKDYDALAVELFSNIKIETR